MTQMAVRDGEDAALDEAVRRFYAALLQKANNNRRSPLFAVYFPDGMAPVVNSPLEAELQRVGVLVGKLQNEKDETLRSHVGPLNAAMVSLSAAIDAHRAALDAELQAYGLVEQEKINWLDAYKLSHRTLVQRYYNDPKKAESFFKPAARAKKSAAAGAVAK